MQLMQRLRLGAAAPQLTARRCRSVAQRVRPSPVRRVATSIVAGMALSYASPIVCNPESGAPTSAVIFLHGLGDSGHGWAEVASQFQDTLKHTRFIFPHAPRRPITLNWGMAMPGWFDIASLEDVNQKEDDAGISESARYVLEIIDEQVQKGIPSSSIAICGFSQAGGSLPVSVSFDAQGGAIALYLLRKNVKLAAVAGLSTWLPLSKVDSILSAENKDTPVLMCHGDADNVVAYQFGRASYSKLATSGATVDFATYQGMAHSACPQELKDIQDFLAKHVPK